MRKREFETDRGTLRYWVSENDEETAQLVFLPGLTADHRLFDKQVDCFAQRARCLVWDPPSHGESRPFSLDWSLDDLALMLEQILSREGFERPILIGQSMGGYVSQAFIRLFPDGACGFVSVDSCPLDRSYYTAIELWALKHREECLQKALPVLDVHPFVIVMAVQQWRRVQRNIRQPLVMQGVFVKFDLLIDAGVLLMEDEGEKIVFRLSAAFTGLVDEQAYLGHRHLLIKKSPGDNPRLLEALPFGKTFSIFS